MLVAPDDCTRRVRARLFNENHIGFPHATHGHSLHDMNFYHYLYSCAYWVSIEDQKEQSRPQEYAFMVVCIVDLELFVALSGSLNLYFSKNILSGLVVILVSALIALLNYLIFLRAAGSKK